MSTSAPSVLEPGSVTRDPAERPRSGTVQVAADFTATRAGEANVIARGSRTCEAMAAPACKSTGFTITVLVS